MLLDLGKEGGKSGARFRLTSGGAPAWIRSSRRSDLTLQGPETRNFAFTLTGYIPDNCSGIPTNI